MVVFNLAIFATFDNDSYSVQVPKTLQKEGIRAKFDFKAAFMYTICTPLCRVHISYAPRFDKKFNTRYLFL